MHKEINAVEVRLADLYCSVIERHQQERLETSRAVRMLAWCEAMLKLYEEESWSERLERLRRRLSALRRNRDRAWMEVIADIAAICPGERPFRRLQEMSTMPYADIVIFFHRGSSQAWVAGDVDATRRQWATLQEVELRPDVVFCIIL